MNRLASFGETGVHDVVPTTRRALSWFGIAALLLLAACSKKEDEPAGTPPPTPPARSPAGPDSLSGELVRVKGVPVLRLWGGPRKRGYAHGYLLAREIADFFKHYLPLLLRSREAYETGVRPEVRSRYQFPAEIREELAGMLDGIRARLGEGGLPTWLGRRLDLIDLLCIQALSDWHPFYCSAFVAWGELSPDGPIAGRNVDFFVHPVLLENHILIASARSGTRPAWVSVTWPGLVVVFTGLSEDGVATFLLDANAPPVPTGKGLLPRMVAVRRVVESAGPDDPATRAMELLKGNPTRWGGNIFVAGPVPGRAGVVERDARGTSLRAAAHDPVARGVPAFACTNHFRVRAEPVDCERYATISRGLSALHGERRTLDVEGAFMLLSGVSQKTTMQSVVVNLRTRDVWLKLARPGVQAEDTQTTHLGWDEITGGDR